jgi:hypothetical protein
MKKNLIVIAFIFIYGCQQNEIPPTGLVGNWLISKIDSVKSSEFEERVVLFAELPETGEITFNNDSTGYFENSIRDMTCGYKDFVWTYDYNPNDVSQIEGRTYLILTFENGSSKTSHYYQVSNDTIDFFFMAYCGDRVGGVGLPWYYRLTLIRK